MNRARDESTHHVQSIQPLIGEHDEREGSGSKDEQRESRNPPRWPRIIGILGGLGPHAHIELERRLLEAVGYPEHEQDYPEWFLASLPATPDRTLALLGGGPSPVPALALGLRRLEPLVDFAVIACHTAHAFLGEAQSQVRLPILSLIEQVVSTLDVTLGSISGAPGERPRCATVGLLATTGTLHARLYPKAALHAGHALEFISLLDLPDGQRLQDELVMRPVYGTAPGRRASGGLKSGGTSDPESRRRHADVLHEAGARLTAAGAECILPACTEISLALRGTVHEVPIFDPLEILAAAALEVASGRRPLPKLFREEISRSPLTASEAGSPAYGRTFMAS